MKYDAREALAAVAATLDDSIRRLEAKAEAERAREDADRGYLQGLREGLDALRDVRREMDLQQHTLTVAEALAADRESA